MLCVRCIGCDVTDIDTTKRTRAVKLLIGACMGLLVLGCAKHSYVPEPVDVVDIVGLFGERSLENADLQGFMADHGAGDDHWPKGSWDLSALTLAAIYYDPELSVARAAWQAERAAEITAGQRSNPNVSPEVAYSGDTAPREDSPWSAGFVVSVPVPWADKRTPRIDRALARAEQARFEVAATAWRARQRVRRAMLSCYEAERNHELLREELDRQEAELAVYQALQSAGEIGLALVAEARGRRHEIALALAETDGARQTCRARLADALAVPFPVTRDLTLDFDSFVSQPDLVGRNDLRQRSLINRLDVRGAVAGYRAAEAALRLEIAHQYPDLTFSPGILWDQGSLVWSLGATVWLAIANRNEGPIAEAEAARRLAAEKLAATQTRALTDLSTTSEAYRAAIRTASNAANLVSEARDRRGAVEKRFAHGDVSQLERIRADLELIRARRAQLEKDIAVIHALGALEDVVQKPLNGDPQIPGELENALTASVLGQ